MARPWRTILSAPILTWPRSIRAPSAVRFAWQALKGLYYIIRIHPTLDLGKTRENSTFRRSNDG